jgi:hypothetical protein
MMLLLLVPPPLIFLLLPGFRGLGFGLQGRGSSPVMFSGRRGRARGRWWTGGGDGLWAGRRGGGTPPAAGCGGPPVGGGGGTGEVPAEVGGGGASGTGDGASGGGGWLRIQRWEPKAVVEGGGEQLQWQRSVAANPAAPAAGDEGWRAE